MSKSEQLYIAQTMGTEFTLYSTMRKLGLTLTEEQAKVQAYLEAHYPPVVDVEEEQTEGESNGMES